MFALRKTYFGILIFISIVNLSILQELDNVSKHLKALAEKLNHDKDIQEKIYDLAFNGQSVAKSFARMLQEHAGKLYREKNSLIKLSSPENVNTAALKATLKSTRESLLLERDKILKLQTDIHVNIEISNERKRQLEEENEDIKNRLDLIPKQIQILDEDIKIKEASILASKRNAEINERMAYDLRRKAESERGGPLGFGILCAVAGAVLAPFTGFATLPMVGGGAAAGFSIGVLLSDAVKYEMRAQNYREEANWQLSRTETLEWKKADLQDKKSSMEDDMIVLQSKSDDIGQAFRGLQDVTIYLRSAVNRVDKVLDAVQDFDTALKEADLQSDSFSIVKEAFVTDEEKIKEKSNGYLNELKKKWKRLEGVFFVGFSLREFKGKLSISHGA